MKSRRSRTAVVVLLGLLATGCASQSSDVNAASSDQPVPARVQEPSRSNTAVQPEPEPTMTSATDVSFNDEVIATWGSQADTSSAFFEYPEGLRDIARRSSVAVVGRIIGPTEGRTVVGDTPDDVVTVPAMEVEVIEYLGGTRRPDGDTIVMRGLGVPSDAASLAGSEAVLFLRHLRDDNAGRGHPSLAGEDDAYRLVSLEGVAVDRGDGQAIAPVGEVMQMLESGQGPDLDAWLRRSERARSPEFGVTDDVRGLTVEELKERVRSFAGPSSG